MKRFSPAELWPCTLVTTVEQLAKVFDLPLTAVLPRGAVRVGAGA